VTAKTLLAKPPNSMTIRDRLMPRGDQSELVFLPGKIVARTRMFMKTTLSSSASVGARVAI
jgi:hypothetical protein